MDAAVRRFIEQIVQNTVGLDLALFLRNNPNTVDTAPGIALRLGRDVLEVRPALERFSSAGLLCCNHQQNNRPPCYYLRVGSELWTLLCEFAENYGGGRETRLVIWELLRETQSA